MLHRALRACEHGEFDQAERFYTAVLGIRPDHFDALHGLGLLNYRRGHLDAAPERPAKNPGPAGAVTLIRHRVAKRSGGG